MSLKAPGDPLPEVRVRAIGAGGSGVGSLPDGRVVFLPRTAPGDRVRVRLQREKARWARGEVVEWLERGPARRDPPCPLYSRCDGCSLQHLEYREQLHWKGNLVGEALRRIGGLQVPDPPVEPSPLELRYRNKVTFTLRRLGRGRVVAGFRELGSPGRVLDVDHRCLLPEECLARSWGALRAGWGENGALLPRGRELRLTLRAGKGGVSLLVRGGDGEGEPATLLERIPELRGIWREERGRESRLLAGDPAVSADWQEGEVEVRGGAFLQVNTGAAEHLHRHVRAAAGEVSGLRVVDAYCGAAQVGAALAEVGAQVTGIEADPSAVAMARARGQAGLRVMEGKVEALLEAALPAHLLILNPPRTGLEESIPEVIRRRPPGRLVYVSCDPATLARDLTRLGAAFSMEDVRSFDLFPQTEHVETVVILNREGIEGCATS